MCVCVESLRNNLHRERFYRQREFNNRSKEERTDKAQLVKYANETELKSVMAGSYFTHIFKLLE